MGTLIKKHQIYLPGSKEAIKLGCDCPILENNLGEGINNDHKKYEVYLGCPLHSSLIAANPSLYILSQKKKYN